MDYYSALPCLCCGHWGSSGSQADRQHPRWIFYTSNTRLTRRLGSAELLTEMLASGSETKMSSPPLVSREDL